MASTSRRLNVLDQDYHPRYVIWELTLRCDQPCTHCGPRAGISRDSELTTAEALKVVEQLAAMRAREVTLIGGEAYLHPGFLDVAKGLTAAGVQTAVTTGGAGNHPSARRGDGAHRHSIGFGEHRRSSPHP